MDHGQAQIRMVWDGIRRHLEDERARVFETIRHYPTPIAGCDQQFNHLLLQRGELARLRSQLDESQNLCRTAEDPAMIIEQFLAPWTTCDRDTKDEWLHLARQQSPAAVE